VITTRAWRASDGAVSTEQRVRLSSPAVPASRAGAIELGRAYWLEVERALHGLVRVRQAPDRIEIRLLARGPALIRLGAPEVTLDDSLVACRYPIDGGLLTRIPAGALTLEQVTAGTVELRSSVAGFHPRLDARPGFPRWTGVLYPRVQARLHDAVGRRFLARLAGGGAA
jgi:hypothetical protein